MSIRETLRHSYTFNFISFYVGKIIFSITGYTPRLSYMSMINLYCITRGEFFEISKKRNKYLYKKKRPSKIFTQHTKKDVDKIVDRINEEGYYVFPDRIQDSLIEEFKSTVLDLTSEVNGKKIKYDPNNLQSKIYKYNIVDLLNKEVIQDLITDEVILNIVGTYLKKDPIFDFVSMWWSTNFKSDEDAAQEFHFDFDRQKWLKIFIYLTNVDENSGPHCYIAKSHKPGKKPSEILNKGYVRVPDKELKRFYSDESFKEIIGKSGTVVIGDTSCWHKGKPIKTKGRLILQIEYTSSLFGLNLPKINIERASKGFKEIYDSNKYIFQNINIK